MDKEKLRERKKTKQKQKKEGIEKTQSNGKV